MSKNDDKSTTTTTTIDTMEPVAKKQKKEEEEIPPLQPLLLNRKDIWLENILPFLGIGNYVFVAGICKNLKKSYEDYYCSEEKEDKLPEVKIRVVESRKAHLTDTFYREAFTSLSRAKFWDEITNQKADRLPENQICETIAKYGDVPTLEWARKQREFPWDEDTCSAAARAGNIEILRYAHKNGCPWDGRTCSSAAEAGRLDILRYAHENGCPWDEFTCSDAASVGRLDILRYAHENDCDWDSTTLALAILNGHQEIVEYARANRCPEPSPDMI